MGTRLILHWGGPGNKVNVGLGMKLISQGRAPGNQANFPQGGPGNKVNVGLGMRLISQGRALGNKANFALGRAWEQG